MNETKCISTLHDTYIFRLNQLLVNMRRETLKLKKMPTYVKISVGTMAEVTMFKFLSIKVRIDLSCNLQFSSSQTPFSNLPETYMGMGCIGSLVHNLAGVQSRAVERVFDVLAFWRRRSIPIYSRD